MWRRMGRAPQSVAGTGMTAQGFDRSTYYERTPRASTRGSRSSSKASAPTSASVTSASIGGGAAGWEIDRADPALGTPPHALVVARATASRRLPLDEGGADPHALRDHRRDLPARALRHGASTRRRRRRGVLDQLDRLGGRARAQRLRQQRRPHHRQRGATIHRFGAVRLRLRVALRVLTN